MTDTAARLSEPITAAAPCGVDFSGHADLFEIERLARGKPATQFSDEQEPDWQSLRKLCETTLAQSKHLTVLVYYLLTLLQTDGVAGEAEGLELLRAVLERYWPELFPALDPADGNDPTLRLNILSNLTAPIGSYEDPFRFVERVRRVALFSVPRMGAVSLANIARGGSASEGSTGIDPSQLEAMLADVAPAELNASRAFIARSIEALSGIASFLESTLGAAVAPSWETLMATLKEQARVLGTGAGTQDASANGTGDQKAGAGVDPAGALEPISRPSGRIGAIQTREDVVRAIAAICDYYQRHEPSSPVPFLLRRAESLVQKNFLDVIADLAPEATTQVKIITGPSSG